MKFYVHSEELEFTMVIQWDPGNSADINSIIKLFLGKLENKFPEQYRRIESSTIKVCKGSKPLKHTDQVIKSISNLDDLYVSWQQKDAATASKEGKKETHKNIKESVTGKTSVGCSGVKAETNCGIDQMLSKAESLSQQLQQREAILLYEDVLRQDQQNKKALNGIIDIYLRANRPSDALKYVERVKHQADSPYRLGQCYVKLGRPDKAIETLIKYCKEMRSNGGMDIDHGHAVQVLLAKAYLLKNQTDMAIVILQGILRANQEYFEALIEYAPLIYPLGPKQREEAVAIMLTALVKKPDDTYVKEKFTSVCVQQDGLQVLQNVSGQAWNDIPALVFMATTLRECGAITEALKLMEHALSLQPSNPHTLLTYVHMLELIEQHSQGISLIKQFVERWPEKSVGKFKCGMLQPILQQLRGDIYLNVPSQIPETTCAIDSVTDRYTDETRYLLALLFTLIKILYAKGALQYIPPITKLLDPLTEHQSLHETNIRNEAAYYFCVSQIMKLRGTEMPRPSPCQRYIYFVGDSHCVPPAWQLIQIQGDEKMIHPVLSTGTKIWHLRENCKFYPKINFKSAIKTVPDGADVVFCFGEIDCREALLFCVEKAKYDSLEEAIDTVISIYINLLLKLKEERKWRIFVHPVMPVLDITRPVVLQFNSQLSQRLQKETQLKWLDFADDLLIEINGEIKLKPRYEFDGTHAHPCYISLLVEKLEKSWSS